MYSSLIKSQYNNCLSINKSVSRVTNLDFINSYRGSGKDIITVLLALRGCKKIKISNETIAKQVGCSPRTVQRWTARFVLDGILTKHHRDYNLTEYKFTITNQASFQYHLTVLKSHQLEGWRNEGIIPKDKGGIYYQYNQTVTPNRVIYIKETPLSVETAIDGDGWGKLPKKVRERRIRVEKGLKMLDEAQREFIGEHKKQPEMKDLLMKEPLRSHLVTPDNIRISRLLKLTDQEQMKLIAYPDEMLSRAWIQVEKMMNNGGPQQRIHDKAAWLFGTLNIVCAKANIKPDWKWYYDVCDIIGMDKLSIFDEPIPIEATSNPRPKKAKSFVNQEVRPPMYLVWDNPQDKISRAEKIATLEKEIHAYTEQLAEPEKYYGPMFIESNIKIVQRMVRESLDKLEALR
jgi:DNA-binding Lrp family transcriptional regulator